MFRTDDGFDPSLIDNVVSIAKGPKNKYYLILD